MSTISRPITPDLIVDYAAGRLDAREADRIEAIMSRDGSIAEAVAAARQLNSRIGRYLSRRGPQGRR